jgi:hypothetical protein
MTKARTNLLAKSRDALAYYAAYKRTVAPSLEIHEKVLSAASQRGLLKFDPLRIAPLRLMEVAFSDALAALLDAHGTHNVGVVSLDRILSSISRGVRDAQTKKSIAAVRAAIKRDGSYQVKREYSVDRGRPDIVVIGETFLVAFEVKRSTGFETYISKKPQTVRHAAGLIREAKERGIPRANIIFIFLSPGGIRASSSHFLTLSADSLAACLARSFGRQENLDRKSLDALLYIYGRN